MFERIISLKAIKSQNQLLFKLMKTEPKHVYKASKFLVSNKHRLHQFCWLSVSFFEKLGQSIRFNSFHPGILIVIVVLQDYLSVLIEFLYYLFIDQVIEDVQNFLTPDRANILFLSKK